MSYSELVLGRLYFGGVDDLETVKQNEKIDVIYDVRIQAENNKENNNCPIVAAPIEEGNLSQTIKGGAQNIKAAYEEGKNVYIHCGSGNGRASVMSAAVLLELGFAKNLEEAEQIIQSKRYTANIRPHMHAALEESYEK